MTVFDAMTVKTARLLVYILAATLGATLLLVTLTNLLIGTPDAKLPASSLFYAPDMSRWDELPRDVSTGDFEERPLFSDSRRPFVPAEQEPAVAERVPNPVPRQTLKGWSLLGIFNSGEVEGAIVRQKDGTRRRVLVGDTAGGWRLLSVEPRRAVFRSQRSTDEAELTMSLVSLEGLVRSVPTGSVSEEDEPDRSSEKADNDQSSPGGGVKTEEAPPRRDPTVFGLGIKRDG
jgi:hypothetical protein